MQLKMSSGHTFCLERVAANKIVMYNAYEGNISLTQWLDQHELGQGAVKTQEILNLVIIPMSSSLNAKSDQNAWPAQGYNRAFGCNSASPVNLHEVVAIAFDLPGKETGIDDNKRGFLTLQSFVFE